MKKLLLSVLIISGVANAELVGLADEELQSVDGQSGLTINARVELRRGSVISYSTDYDNIDYNSAQVDKRYWMVLDHVNGGLEFSGLKFDLTETFGPNKSEEALVWTMPERIEFYELETEGLYLADSYVVSGGNDRYILGLSVDGSLYLPAQTKVNVFPTN